MMRKVAIAAAVVFLASVAQADSGDSTSYLYTGNQLSNSGNPNTLLSPSGQYVPGLPSCTCSITGELTFAQALDLPTDIETVTGVPTSYSFSVDGFTVNQANSTITQFFLGDLWWGLNIVGTNGVEIETVCDNGCGNDGGATDSLTVNGSLVALEIGNKGTWATEVPEPAVYWMLMAGVAILAWTKRKLAL
jgi:hypothetical protein